MNTTQPKFAKNLTLATPRTKCDNQKYSMHRGRRGTIHNTECIVGDRGRGRPCLLLIVVIGLASDINDATKIRNKKTLTLASPRTKYDNQKYGMRRGRRGTRRTSPPPHCHRRVSIKNINIRRAAVKNTTQPKIKSHIRRASGAMGDEGNIAYSSSLLAGDNKNRKKKLSGAETNLLRRGGRRGGGGKNGGSFVAGE